MLNALIWGSSWWPFRQLELRGLHPLWSTVLIFLLSATVIVLTQPQAFRQLLRTPTLWIVLVASGITNAAFNWGVVIGDVVRVVLLFYLMPLWTIVLARLILHEPLTLKAGLRVMLALAGAAIVLWPAQGGLPLPRSLPDWLGVIGGLSFALNNVMLRREAHQPRAGRALAMFLGGVLVSTVLATLLASQGHMAWPPPPEWPWLVIALALGGCFLVSNLALQYGAARLPANITSVVMLTEVVFASSSAILLGSSTLTPSLALGGGLIVAAALLSAFERAPVHG